MTYKHGHMFVKWDQSKILFTRKELSRLYPHFMHLCSSQLFQLISRSNPTNANPSIFKLVNDVAIVCNYCKTLQVIIISFQSNNQK